MVPRYSEETKQNVLECYQSWHTVHEVCSQFGMARSTLLLWARQYSEDVTGQIPRERYLMKKELMRLRTENQIFKESGCCPTSPIKEKMAAIERLREQYSIHILCQTLNVNRSTYYYYAKRSSDKTKVELEDGEIKPRIIEIFEKSAGKFGARKIRTKLMEQGFAVSERRIVRLMKELGLSANFGHPRLNSANDREYKYYPNKLKHVFLTDAPNKIWVSDITYAKVGMDFLYLCVIIDLYSRRVVSYGISENIESDFVIDTFDRAFQGRDCPANLIFHSDQGTQYTSYAFRKFLHTRGVKQSFSAPGSPHDNAVAESFFASIKKEDFRRNYYRTEEEFRVAVEEHIRFYNEYRPHQHMGYQTPCQIETTYYR